MLLEDEKKREQLSRIEEKERMRAKIKKCRYFVTNRRRRREKC